MGTYLEVGWAGRKESMYVCIFNNARQAEEKEKQDIDCQVYLGTVR